MSASDSILQGRLLPSTPPRVVLAAVIFCVAASSGSSAATSVAAGPTCNRWASVTGSDDNPGSKDAPVRTLKELVARLSPGQTGCLKADQTFGGAPDLPYGDLSIIGNDGGTQTKPIVIRSSPAGRASYRGQIWLKESAHDLVFRNINFRGTKNIPKGTHLIVDGNRIHFRRNNITSPEGICIDVGDLDAYGTDKPSVRSNGFRLVRNRIHDCGSAAQLSSSDSGVHGVYLVNTIDARIVDNFIFDNRNRGLQLWPNADATTVRYNTFDGNGSNINIGSCWQDFCSAARFSENTLIENNVISNSKLLSNTNENVPPGDTHQIVGNFPNDGERHGNLVASNCIHQANPSKNFGGYGYSRRDNLFARPMYVDRSANDLRLSRRSPCNGNGVR